MKNISILTATRAEYGLLKPIIEKLGQQRDFKVRVVVTGTHLSPEFGMTYREIEEDGIEIDEKIEILLSADTPSAVSKTMGMAMISFADYFGRKKPDMLVILGDRYESLAVASVAMNYRIPIAHIHGGETTEGAMDEYIRHAITKLSYIHFTSTEEYRKRVIQMGEDPSRVKNVGATGVENALRERLMKKEELEKSIGLKLDKPYIVVTFHPVTLEEDTAKEQVLEILKFCQIHNERQFIFTKANSDSGGRVINKILNDFAKENDNAWLFDSLGRVRYLSLIKYSELVMGNSSSGLIEVPVFDVPTINIGDRQRGRVQGKTIINCNPDVESIEVAFKNVTSKEFKDSIKGRVNTYGSGDTSSKIVEHIREIFKEGIDLKKKFFDIGRGGFIE